MIVWTDTPGAGAIVRFAVVSIAIVAGILLLTDEFLASTFGIEVF